MPGSRPSRPSLGHRDAVTPSGPPSPPVLLPIPRGPGLVGPPHDARALLPPESPSEPITGGGWTGVVTAAEGIRALFGAGGAALTGRVVVSGTQGEGRGIGPLILGVGGWERQVELPCGEVFVERGVLLDSGPALAVEWRRPDGTPPPVLEVTVFPPEDSGVSAPASELRSPWQEFPLQHSLGGESGVPGILLLPPGTDPTRIPPRVLPIQARERARYGRSPTPGLQLRTRPGWTEEGGPAQGGLDEAVLMLDRVATGVDGQRQPAPPFLVGLRDGVPVQATGSALAELGLAALMAGRHPLAWSLFETLARTPASSPIPLLHLANEVAAWTGDLPRLAALRPELDEAVEWLVQQCGGHGAPDGSGPIAPLPAGWPGPRTTLRRLAQGVERAGGGWRASLLHQLRRLEEAGAGSPPGARRALPVLGAKPEAPPSPDTEPPPQVPKPASFAPVLDPGQGPRRALHAARLVRSWVEGVLGATPDVTYGRLELSPDLTPGPGRLEIRHLRTGDASVALDYRLDGSTCTLRLFQESGGLPLNLVLHLSVPLEPPLVVTLGDETVDLPGEPVEGGARVSLQFPLDPERRILIERA